MSSVESIRSKFPLPCVLFSVAGFKFSFLWWGNFWIINYIFFFLSVLLVFFDSTFIYWICFAYLLRIYVFFYFFQLFIFLHWLNFFQNYDHSVLPPILLLLYSLSNYYVYSCEFLCSLFKSFYYQFMSLPLFYSLSPCWIPVC